MINIEQCVIVAMVIIVACFITAGYYFSTKVKDVFVVKNVMTDATDTYNSYFIDFGKNYINVLMTEKDYERFSNVFNIQIEPKDEI